MIKKYVIHFSPSAKQTLKKMGETWGVTHEFVNVSGHRLRCTGSDTSLWSLWSLHAGICRLVHHPIIPSSQQIRPVAHRWQLSLPLPRSQSLLFQFFHYHNAPLKGLGKFLAVLPSRAGTRILSGYLRPFLPRQATGNSYPHHTPCWIKGSWRSCCLPRLQLNWGSDPPLEFLLFFSFLVFGLRQQPGHTAHSLGIIPISNLCVFASPPSSLENLNILSGKKKLWLTWQLTLWSSEIKYWLLCSVFCYN